MRRSHSRALRIRRLAPGVVGLGCLWAMAMEGGQMQSAPGSQGGASTAGAFAPVHDAEHRPITAGGFVDHGPVVFTDASRSSGLTAWRLLRRNSEKQYIVESLGGGVALLDYDRDGWLDIYLVNGMTYDAMSGKAEPSSCGALPQQSRRHLHQRRLPGRRDQRPLGSWRGRRRL